MPQEIRVGDEHPAQAPSWGDVILRMIGPKGKIRKYVSYQMFCMFLIYCIIFWVYPKQQAMEKALNLDRHIETSWVMNLVWLPLLQKAEICIWIVLFPTYQWRRIIQPWNVQVLTKQRRTSGIEDMDILEEEIWNELQRNNWLMNLIMNQRRNQVFVNHMLVVSRVHCHFPRQEEKGLMNSLASFIVMHVERLRQSHLVEQNAL